MLVRRLLRVTRSPLKTYMVAPLSKKKDTVRPDSKSVSTRQASIANFQRQIESLDRKLLRLEENFDSGEIGDLYESM